ncbi:PAS domain-containing protein [Mesorhizobium sp. M0571]|uniref:PAS domain-containing protein n=1 Tax=Mesorhizobium sp. M0571 TaxID=2956960 RepID=UPI0033369FF7
MERRVSKDGNGGEEALFSGEQELRLLVETIPTLVWRAEPEGNIEYVNKRVLDYFGAPLGEITGWGWAERIHPEDVAFKVSSWLENLETESPHDVVCRFRGADGQYRWFNVRGAPLKASDGRVLRWYGVLVDIDEAKKAEDRLRRSEAHLAEAQSLSRTGSTIYSETTLLYWSEETYRIYGFDPALGIPSFEAVLERVHLDDRDRVLAAAERAYTEKRGYSIAYRIILPDGTVKHLESIGRPVFSSNGRIVEFFCTNMDVTERKRAEEALRESEHKLRQIFETVPSLLWSADPAGEPTQLNQRLLDYSGMRLEDFRHGGWETFLHPDDFPETAKAFQHAIQTGTSYEAVNRLRRADGEFRWHHTRGEPLRDQQGRIVQWYGVSVDIDEAKKAEDRLRRSEAHLAEAQRLSHSGATAANKSKVLYFSEEAYRIWGFDPTLGIPSFEMMAERLHPDDRDRVLAGVQLAFTEKRGYSHEYRILLPDGTVKHIESIGEPVLSASGELFELVATQIDVTERKRAEKALRESEYKLRQIFETVPGLLWSLDPAGEPTQLNQRLLDYSGMRFEEFKQRGWEAFVHPDDLPETASAFQHAIQTGTSYQAVNRLRRADGEFRWHHARGEPLRNRQGRIIQWYGLSVDIDGAKKAEERLRRSEAYLAEAQRLSHSGVSAFNETKILYGSEETYRIWGFDPAQGVPSREAVFQRIHPSDRDRLNAEVQRAVGEKRGYSIGYRIVLPDGTVKHLEVIGQTVFSASGELVEIVTTQIDVTERKRASEALQESQAKFRDYAESASDWFWEIGPDYKFTLLTENAFGSDSADRIGTACWDGALDLETEPEKWRLLQTTLDSRKSFRDFVYHSARRHGSSIHVKATGKPVFDAEGKFRGYRGTGTDVTALMRAQEEHERLRQLESDLAHMNRLSVMGELTASLAHEITQPIAAARNNARAAMHFLDRNPPDLGEIREALASIVDDADRAGDIIDRIRDHIKKAPPRKSRLDLNEAIDEVIGLAQSAITTNGVSVRTRLAEGLYPVEGDRVQLQQVVLNLILNAVEAMSTLQAEPREMSISTEQTQTGGVLVSVRDSGPGIDPDNLDRVFEAFYTTKSNGVGMGLSISQSIIEAHGGRLWADMNASGGAALRFFLPGAGKALTNSRRSAAQTGEPHEDAVMATSKRPAT